MFLKIVETRAVGGNTTILREIKSLQHYAEWDEIPGEIVLVLEVDGDTLRYSENRAITVYLMNEDGKTIDKIEWDYEIAHQGVVVRER